MIAKTMIMAVDSPAGSQRPKQAMTQRPIDRMRVFMRPIISATRPAKKRPKKEPALRIARIWKPNAELWPWDAEYDVMYVSGTKIPHSMRKMPIVTNVNGRSLKTVKSGAMLLKLPIGFRGRRLLTRRFASTSRKTRIKPKILVDQAKPTMGKSLCSIRGKMIPPMEPEVIATPVALPRLRRKK